MNQPNKIKTDHHATPKRVFDFVKKELGINLKEMFDPCPLHCKFDNLVISWHNQNFVNPPYSKIEAFVDKCYKEWSEGKECYLLFPLIKSDKPYFTRMLQVFRNDLLFFPFRIQFKGNLKPSFTTHCLVIMK